MSTDKQIFEHSVQDGHAQVSVDQFFAEENLRVGRIISPYKKQPEGQLAVWNANVISSRLGKIWYGDINIDLDGPKLKRIAAKMGEPLYVLKEMDARFGKETEPTKNLIKLAVWNTQME